MSNALVTTDTIFSNIVITAALDMPNNTFYFPVSDCSFTHRFAKGTEGAEPPLDKDMVSTDIQITCPDEINNPNCFDEYEATILPVNADDINYQGTVLTIEVGSRVINPVSHGYVDRTASASATPQTISRNQTATEKTVTLKASGEKEYTDIQTWEIPEECTLNMDYDNSDISFTVPFMFFRIDASDILPGDIFEIGDKRIISSEISCTIRTKSIETSVKGKYTTI